MYLAHTIRNIPFSARFLDRFFSSFDTVICILKQLQYHKHYKRFWFPCRSSMFSILVSGSLFRPAMLDQHSLPTMLRGSFFIWFHIRSSHMIYFICIIHFHIFHGNIWTHNWPAPNVSGFIAQLVERRTRIARSRVQAPLKSWIFFQDSLRNCKNCDHNCEDHSSFDLNVGCRIKLCSIVWPGLYSLCVTASAVIGCCKRIS